MLQRMFRVGFFSLAVVGLLLSLASSNLVARGAGSGSLTILHTQEHHGQVLPARPFRGNDFGGVSARATLVRQIRSEVGADNMLLLDTGDVLVGTPIDSVFRGEPTVLAYNSMGYDAQNMGNHAFDFETSENRLEILEGLADYPIMAANVSGLNFDADPGFIKKTVGGLNVLIIGIGNVDTPEISNPTSGTKFADPIQTVKDVVAAQGGDADLIIAQVHEDTFRDIDLFESVPEVDVVIGGHTFGFRGMVTRGVFTADSVPSDPLPDQPTSLDNPNGVYVRAGEGPFKGRLGTSLGRLDITVENGKVVKATSDNIVVMPANEFNLRSEDGAPAPEDLTALDPEVESILQPFIDELDTRLSVPLGRSDVDLDGARENVRTKETNLGDFIADVWRISQGTDIGLQNGGGIRNPVPSGDISFGDLLSIQPFGNTVVTFDLTGAQLQEAMENSVSRVEDGSGRFMQISGMTLKWDSSQPAGSRVVEITVGGAPLDKAKVYSVATNSFVAGGGDGYEVFTRAQNFFDTQFVDVDVVADFVRSAGTISPTTDGRIVDVANP